MILLCLSASLFVISNSKECSTWFIHNIYIYIYAFIRCFYPKRLTVLFRLYMFLSVCVFPGKWTHNLCAANAMLYHWATGTQQYFILYLYLRYIWIWLRKSVFINCYLFWITDVLAFQTSVQLLMDYLVAWKRRCWRTNKGVLLYPFTKSWFRFGGFLELGFHAWLFQKQAPLFSVCLKRPV